MFHCFGQDFSSSPDNVKLSVAFCFWCFFVCFCLFLFLIRIKSWVGAAWALYVSQIHTTGLASQDLKTVTMSRLKKSVHLRFKIQV